MKNNLRINNSGMSLIEVLVGTAVFLLFALAIYGGISMVFKIVYISRVRIIETAILSEKLEVARNLPFDQVGIINGIPVGQLAYLQNVTRNGITFTITTAVRNIDDPFDGTVTTTPKDTSPADYKLVEMSIICQQCPQQKPVILSTRVAPKGLEGASDNGSIFVYVNDKNGMPIQGATIHITNDTLTTTLDLTDVTDNNGVLMLIDTPTSTQSYQVTVTKDGYSSDYTLAASSTNPNPDPSMIHLTVATQNVTEKYFSIDKTSSFTLNTIDQSCQPIGGVNFNMRGEKKIGGSNPNYVYKFDNDYNSDSNGLFSISTLEWDNYHLSTSGTIYDVAGIMGSSYLLPIQVIPDSSAIFSLMLKSHSANSILVQVVDSSTLLPIANATVELAKVGQSTTTIETGVGYQVQSDWSGGSGVDFFNSSTVSYFSDNSNLVVDSPAGNIKLKKVGIYQTPGILESATFDMGVAVDDFRSLVFDPLTQPVSTSVKVQIATSNSSTPASWNFVGPDGSGSSYYTATNNQLHTSHDGNRYLRYKLYLETTNTAVTPEFYELAITYINSCIPPGQAFYGSLSSGQYNIAVSHNSYQTYTDQITISGNMIDKIQMSSI